MVAEVFLSVSGPLARTVVDFYIANQIIFNLIIAGYGVILILGHRNIRRIETALVERYGTDDWPDVLALFCTDSGALDQVTRGVTPRFIASPYFFALYSVRETTIIQVIGKKYAVSRKLLAELINSTKETER